MAIKQTVSEPYAAQHLNLMERENNTAKTFDRAEVVFVFIVPS